MNHFWSSAHSWGDKAYITEYIGTKRQPPVPVKMDTYLFEVADDGEYRTLEGLKCRKRWFNSGRDARNWLEQGKDIPGYSPKFGMKNFLYTHLNDTYSGEVQYDPTILNRVSIDIETMSDGGFPNVETANKEITAITLVKRQHGKQKILVLGCGVFKPTNPLAQYCMCRDELHLLETFLDFWNEDEWQPDILTGWNIEGFDVPYIVNRIRRLMGEESVKRLSPFRIVQAREIARGQTVGGKNSMQTVYELFGISVLDYLQLYKKFSFKNQESWKLDHIAFVELGKRKKDYSMWASLHEFFMNDYQGFMDYNVEDAILVDELDDKMSFIDLVLAFAYDAKVTMNDTMTTTRPWDVIIHNTLMADKIVVPQSLGSTFSGHIPGGYVKEVIPGLYEGVVSFDFDSLYPHLIMGWNISPETYLGRVDFNGFESLNRGTFEADVAALQPLLKEKDAILAGNGCLFSRSRKGFLPYLMEKMYADRVVYKKKMLEAKRLYEETKDPELLKAISKFHNLQLAKKIQLNSGYGALANEWFRWFAHHLAESITMSGQMSNRFTELGINGYLNKILQTEGKDYVCAADTDSLYLVLNDLIRAVDLEPNADAIDFMDKVCEQKLQPFITKRCQTLADMVGCPTMKLRMKRESLANKAIWTATKKYLMNVHDLEGVRYQEPVLKVTGIESVRSSTPQICRDNIKKALKIIINGTEKEFQDFIADHRKDFKDHPFHVVACPRGCNNMDKYSDRATIFKKGTPIQVRGALLYNDMIERMKLTDKYEVIHEGTKVKFCYLKMPNPIRQNVIAVPDELPAEFDIQKYIDYETQYEKTFVEPLEKIAHAIGWQTVKTSSLLDFL